MRDESGAYWNLFVSTVNSPLEMTTMEVNCSSSTGSYGRRNAECWTQVWRTVSDAEVWG
jgi:hypothetical protein